jgi:hypothetical protein
MSHQRVGLHNEEVVFFSVVRNFLNTIYFNFVSNDSFESTVHDFQLRACGGVLKILIYGTKPTFHSRNSVLQYKSYELPLS